VKSRACARAWVCACVQGSGSGTRVSPRGFHMRVQWDEPVSITSAGCAGWIRSCEGLTSQSISDEPNLSFVISRMG
jgi:hypothetical protein